ncbi:unnamed protein product [Lepeophtheirus salmonis]|uniref:(salmon louse) hypothetical protein n=1 Tax=Lepeophtheirus salmonis TaxID=72036 RepID=A0A7R8CK48_LEPSM|nr:unnamed protein product [Lepeophtheirus salmonis]CAF2842318.1 unnamed protein product [Lepeophtheirus salmonis]
MSKYKPSPEVSHVVRQFKDVSLLAKKAQIMVLASRSAIQFYRVTEESERYNHLLSAIDEGVLDFFDEEDEDTPSSTSYSDMKADILDESKGFTTYTFFSRVSLDDPEPIIDHEGNDHLMFLVISSASSRDYVLLAAFKENVSLCLVIKTERISDWSKVTEDSYKKKHHAFSLKTEFQFWGNPLPIPCFL